jgi:hypothetical protein
MVESARGRFFYSSGDLRDLQGQVRHLQIVRRPALVSSSCGRRRGRPRSEAAAARKQLAQLVKGCNTAQLEDVINLVKVGGSREALAERVQDAIERHAISKSEGQLAITLAERIGLFPANGEERDHDDQ